MRRGRGVSFRSTGILPVPYGRDACATSDSLMRAPRLLETQFPAVLLSLESARERKAVAGQTLTGLGKWWGRKPLVLCRAILLGLLLPAGRDPRRDRQVFLQLMTMDDSGLCQRQRRTLAEADFTSLTYRQKLALCCRPEQVEGPTTEAWASINAHLGT